MEQTFLEYMLSLPLFHIQQTVNPYKKFYRVRSTVHDNNETGANESVLEYWGMIPEGRGGFVPGWVQVGVLCYGGHKILEFAKYEGSLRWEFQLHRDAVILPKPTNLPETCPGLKITISVK